MYVHGGLCTYCCTYPVCQVCLLVFTRVNHRAKTIWTRPSLKLLTQLLRISLVQKNLPGCFSANYSIIVVGALLLMAYTVLCVWLHKILTDGLPCSGQLNYLFHCCTALIQPLVFSIQACLKYNTHTGMLFLIMCCCGNIS